jgi:glycogen operon protein
VTLPASESGGWSHLTMAGENAAGGQITLPARSVAFLLEN